MDAGANANDNANANANADDRGSTIALRELRSGELIIKQITKMYKNVIFAISFVSWTKFPQEETLFQFLVFGCL